MVGRGSVTWAIELFPGFFNPFMNCPASNGETLTLEICQVWNNLLLSLVTSLLWPGVIVPVRILSIARIDLVKNCKY